MALDRRRPGQNKITTPRKEADKIPILSGSFKGRDDGHAHPSCRLQRRREVRGLHRAYESIPSLPRRLHLRGQVRIPRLAGGGRASARETLRASPPHQSPRKYLKGARCGNIKAGWIGWATSRRKLTSMTCRWSTSKTTSCAAPTKGRPRDDGAHRLGGATAIPSAGSFRASSAMAPSASANRSSTKIPADLGKAMLSFINAVKGSDGPPDSRSVRDARQRAQRPLRDTGRGNPHEDQQCGRHHRRHLVGETIHFRVAFKPVSTIAKERDTVTRDKEATKLSAAGRHDPYVLPRAVPHR